MCHSRFQNPEVNEVSQNDQTRNNGHGAFPTRAPRTTCLHPALRVTMLEFTCLEGSAYVRGGECLCSRGSAYVRGPDLLESAEYTSSDGCLAKLIRVSLDLQRVASIADHDTTSSKDDVTRRLTSSSRDLLGTFSGPSRDLL